MDDRELLNELIAQNPWWKTGVVKLPKNTIKRTLFPSIKKEMNEKEVTAIIGLRSVGKTTVIKQLIQNLLSSKVKPEDILYFSFDGFKKEQRVVKRLLTLYSHSIVKKTLRDLDRKAYIFFDEIQKVSEWGEEIKSYYDKHLGLKFTISGSSGMNILKGSGESLVGRIIIYKLYPFSFREFLRFKGLEVESITLWHPKYPLEGEKLSILFQEYFEMGGFPLFYSTSKERRKPLLKSMVDLTFYRDIVNLFDVKRIDVLEGLFYIFVKESGNVINYAALSNALNTKFETIKSYISYLNSSFLIANSSFFSGSKVKSLEKNEKVYVADHAFGALQKMKAGNKIETVVYNALKASGLDLFYWQDKKKREVDIIALNKHAIPIEVKYRGRILASDLKNLYAFLDKHNIRRGVLVTKDLLEIKKQKGREIHCVPVWLFLLSI